MRAPCNKPPDIEQRIAEHAAEVAHMHERLRRDGQVKGYLWEIE